MKILLLPPHPVFVDYKNDRVKRKESIVPEGPVINPEDKAMFSNCSNPAKFE